MKKGGGGVGSRLLERTDTTFFFVFVFVFEKKRTDITNYNMKIIFLTYSNKSGIKSLRGNEYYKARTD